MDLKSKVARRIFVSSVMAMLFYSTTSRSASLSVQVADSSGAPLENAVVYAEPLAGEVKLKRVPPVEISQVKRQFVPLVTVIQAGTEISFPNYDSVKHHVYSFSPAKHFDLPLYSGKAAEPQLFDKVGTVVLGCNIHDKMLAYVQVVNTPYFGKTDAAGKVRLVGMEAGKYVLKAWHFNLPPLDQTVAQSITLVEGDNAASFKLNTVKKAGDNSNSTSY
ncbi:plastocyanin [Oxalobacteraceae bacterium GrIS 2.11]